MAIPVAAALSIVAREVAKKGVTKAVKKYGKKAVDKVMRQKPLSKGQKKVKPATESQTVSTNYGNRRANVGALKGGAAVAVAGSAGNAVKTANAKGSNKNKEASKGSKFGDKKYVKHGGKNKANVTKEELKKSGLTLTQYMNKWNKSGKWIFTRTRYSLC